MQTLPVIYSRSHHPISYTIRVLDRQGGRMCPFSHVGIITEDGKSVIEAKGGVGVIVTPLSDFIAQSTAWERGVFPCLHRPTAYRRARDELGKPYDLLGVISLGIPFFGRDWEIPNAWWCSEHLAHSSGIFERRHVRTIGVAFCYALTRME